MTKRKTLTSKRNLDPEIVQPVSFSFVGCLAFQGRTTWEQIFEFPKLKCECNVSFNKTAKLYPEGNLMEKSQLEEIIISLINYSLNHQMLKCREIRECHHPITARVH